MERIPTTGDSLLSPLQFLVLGTEVMTSNTKYLTRIFKSFGLKLTCRFLLLSVACNMFRCCIVPSSFRGNCESPLPSTSDRISKQEIVSCNSEKKTFEKLKSQPKEPSTFPFFYFIIMYISNP